MITAEKTVQGEFQERGYVVMEGLLDPETDLQPVLDEYSVLVDRLAEGWLREGKISSYDHRQPIADRLLHIMRETHGACSRHLDISLPQKDIREDTPVHSGPAIFDLLRNPRLLDAVEMFIGPEIYSNPVQHVRIKPPERYFPVEERQKDVALVNTYWHQDQGVISEEADGSDILTVWLPIMEATEENGCLMVVPGSHRGGLAQHCFTPTSKGIPEPFVGDEQVPLPMRPGDVLFMTRLTKHASLPNVSDGVRWSFDLRYSPIGQPTGRPWFPGFVARSRAHDEWELSDHDAWADMWREARSALAHGELPRFNRWDPDDPVCA